MPDINIRVTSNTTELARLARAFSRSSDDIVSAFKNVSKSFGLTREELAGKKFTDKVKSILPKPRMIAGGAKQLGSGLISGNIDAMKGGLSSMAKGAGALAVPLVGILTIIGKNISSIAEFIMRLAPIQAVLQAMSAVLTLFFMPLALMMMQIFLPFVIFFFNLLKKIGLDTWMSRMDKWGQLVGNTLVGLLQFAQPVLSAAAQALMFIMQYLGSGVIAVAIVSLLMPLLIIAAAVKVIQMSAQGWILLGTKIWNVLNSLYSEARRITTAISAINPLNSGIKLPALASGGAVSTTGAAIVHTGETVIPANRKVGGDTINIILNVHSQSFDANRFADEVEKALERKRAMKGRW